LRRLVVIATALAVLTAAASAFAAGGFNTYTATVKGKPNKAGSRSAPAALAFTETYVASGTNGNRTAPLINIHSKIYGLKNNGKGFPTCSLAKIQAAKSDTVCPKGSMVATGFIKALLGPTSDQSSSNPTVLPCDPLLHAYNGGPGKVVYFFVDVAPDHTCAGGAITTGFVGPFQGSIKNVGKNLVINTPIPSYVSFPLSGVEGSLTNETLHWLKVTRKVHGKTVAYTASVGCKHGKRPYSHTFTAELNGQSQSDTVSGSQKCR
jgi:hypothetical protein